MYVHILMYIEFIDNLSGTSRGREQSCGDSRRPQNVHRSWTSSAGRIVCCPEWCEQLLKALSYIVYRLSLLSFVHPLCQQFIKRILVFIIFIASTAKQ